MATTTKVIGLSAKRYPAIWQDALAWFPARADHVPRHRAVRPADAL